MADRDAYEFGTPKLYIRHVPETTEEAPADAYDTANPWTGYVEVGVTVDGVDLPLSREKAGWIGKRLDQAKAAKSTGS